MKVHFRRWFPTILIVSGMLIFSWNALSFYIGYSAPSELKITNLKEKSSLLEPLPIPEIRPSLQKGDMIGELSIPKLNQTYPIYHGTSKDILKKGAGHVEHSALPGEKNNMVVSGHRDTIFRGLKDLEVYDQLYITTKQGNYLYKVKSIRIVDANDRSVLTPKPRATLTLTTCYPFYYFGKAPDRYIVVAEMIQ